MSVGRNAEIGEGVRLREAIVLGGARVREHSLVLHSVLGWDSVVGAWARIEGTPCDPDPNKPFAKMDNVPLFSGDGKLNPSITILGERRSALVCGESANLTIIGNPAHVHVLNSFRLPANASFQRHLPDKSISILLSFSSILRSLSSILRLPSLNKSKPNTETQALKMYSV